MNLKKGLFYIIIATLGFSIIPILANIGFSLDLSAATLLFYRFLIAAVFFLVYCLIKKKSILIKDGKGGLYILIAGIIYAMQCLLFFSAFEFISPSIGEILYHCYPLFILVLAGVFLKESVTKQKVTGVILSVIGVSITLYAPWNSLEIKGIVMVVLTALVSSVYMVFNKKFTSEMDTILLTTYLCIICSFIFLIYSLVMGEFTIIKTWNGWLSVSLLAFWSTIVGLFAFMKSITLLDVGLVSVLSLCEPIFTILLSFLILGTTLTYVQIIGTCIILLAIYVYEKKSPSERKEYER